jgi:hypothetical protein
MRLRGAARIGRRALLLGACMLVLSSVTAGSGTAAAARPPASCGVVGPSVPTCGRWWGEALDVGQGSLVSTVDAAQRAVGRRLDIVHVYHRWNALFPTPAEQELAHQGHILLIGWRPITLSGRSVAWSSIAEGKQNRIIEDIAERLRALHEPVLLAFSYEPERLIGTNGTPAQFAAAFRRVHDLMVQAGATNIRWVWTVMGLSSSYWRHHYAQLWPGSHDVDWIAWDPYNWASCRRQRWQSFEQIVQPFYRWVTSQGFGDKPLMLAEYGTVESSSAHGKADWFEEESQLLTAFPRLKALVYFNLPAPPASCDWLSTTSPSAGHAFRVLANSATFRATTSLDPTTWS